MSSGGSEQGSDEEDNVTIWRDQWDAGCAWWPWASQTDPCGEEQALCLRLSLTPAVANAVVHLTKLGSSHFSGFIHQLCSKFAIGISHAIYGVCVVDLELDLEWLGLSAAQAADPSFLSAEHATRWRLHVLTQQPPAWSYRPAFLLQVLALCWVLSLCERAISNILAIGATPYSLDLVRSPCMRHTERSWRLSAKPWPLCRRLLAASGRLLPADISSWTCPAASLGATPQLWKPPKTAALQQC